MRVFQGGINVLIIETYRVLILRTLSTTDNDGVTRDQTMALIVSPFAARQWLWEQDGKYITT